MFSIAALVFPIVAAVIFIRLIWPAIIYLESEEEMENKRFPRKIQTGNISTNNYENGLNVTEKPKIKECSVVLKRIKLKEMQ